MIPRNQRKYVWEEKQWIELMGDIEYINKRKRDSNIDISHFLGSFVLQEKQYLSGNIGLQSQFMRLENKSIDNISFIMSQSCEYRENLSKGNLLDRAYRYSL